MVDNRGVPVAADDDSGPIAIEPLTSTDFGEPITATLLGMTTELIPAGTPSRQILMIEDHEIVLAGLRWAMQSRTSTLSGYELVVANSLEAAVGLLTPRIELIVLDLHLHGGALRDDPLGGLHLMRSHAPGIPIGLFAADDSIALMCKAIESGAAGVIPKRTPINILLVAIDLMLHGGLYLPPNLISKMRGLEGATAEESMPLRALTGNVLTARQQSVLDLLLLGQSNKDIALRLGLSVGTVKNYVSGLLKLARTSTRGRLQALGREALADPQKKAH